MHVHEVNYWYTVELPLQDEYCRSSLELGDQEWQESSEVLYRCHITVAVKFYCMVLKYTTATTKLWGVLQLL